MPPYGVVGRVCRPPGPSNLHGQIPCLRSCGPLDAPWLGIGEFSVAASALVVVDLLRLAGGVPFSPSGPCTATSATSTTWPAHAPPYRLREPISVRFTPLSPPISHSCLLLTTTTTTSPLFCLPPQSPSRSNPTHSQPTSAFHQPNWFRKSFSSLSSLLHPFAPHPSPGAPHVERGHAVQHSSQISFVAFAGDPLAELFTSSPPFRSEILAASRSATTAHQKSQTIASTQRAIPHRLRRTPSILHRLIHQKCLLCRAAPKQRKGRISRHATTLARSRRQ